MRHRERDLAMKRQKFIDKWHAVLSAEHGPNGQDSFLARDRSPSANTFW